jgi:hypothetical protein
LSEEPVATSELPSRLGRTILGRAFAATWGRLFFGYLSFGEAKESGSPKAKALNLKAEKTASREKFCGIH